MHERSVNKQRYEELQRLREERYEAAKQQDRQAVAVYEARANAQRAR